MITATDLEVRAGARTLLSHRGAALRVQPGDRIGLVGRNGAGKTTTCASSQARASPTRAPVARSGDIGYLPQDPKEGNLEILARDRVLSARGLDTLLSDLEKQQALMAEVVDDADKGPGGSSLRPTRGAVRRPRWIRRRKRGGPHLRESRPAPNVF